MRQTDTDGQTIATMLLNPTGGQHNNTLADFRLTAANTTA